MVLGKTAFQWGCALPTIICPTHTNGRCRVAVVKQVGSGVEKGKVHTLLQWGRRETFKMKIQLSS